MTLKTSVACATLALGLLLAQPTWAWASPQAAPASSEVDQRLALSHRFIAAIQGDQMGQMVAQLVGTIQPNTPGLSSQERARLQEATAYASGRMMPRLMEAAAPVYAEMFTLAELQALVDFYESDLGRSLMAKTYEGAPRMAAAFQAVMPAAMHQMVDDMCDSLECTPQQRSQGHVQMVQQGYPQPAQ